MKTIRPEVASRTEAQFDLVAITFRDCRCVVLEDMPALNLPAISDVGR